MATYRILLEPSSWRRNERHRSVWAAFRPLLELALISHPPQRGSVWAAFRPLLERLSGKSLISERFPSLSIELFAVRALEQRTAA